MFVPDGPPPKWGQQKRRERERDERTGRRRKALKSYRAMGLSGRRRIVPSARLFLPFPHFPLRKSHLGGGILSENIFGKELQMLFMTPFSLEEREKFKYLK
jgi:hypothetical protein